MAKKVIGQIKLHLPGGQATPAPPVGPALGQHGLNIMDFARLHVISSVDSSYGDPREEGDDYGGDEEYPEDQWYKADDRK